MQVTELIGEFVGRGVALHLRNGQLEATHPDGILDDQDFARLRENKDDIIEHLSGAGGSAEPMPSSIDESAARSMPACLDIHLKPEMWIHRDGRAYCPRCGAFKGHLRSAG